MGKNVNGSFIKEDSQVAFRSMKWYSTSFLVGEVQIKNTGHYQMHPPTPPAGMATMRKM